MISESAATEFRASIRGQLLFPGEPAYEEARKIHNAMIDRHPAMIVRCAGVADVISSVKLARKHSLLTSVRGTGHNVSGISLCDDGLVIDLSAMKGIHVDPIARTARVEPGATWAEVNHELQAFSLAATGGYVGTTGVGGLTLGGGLGWMVRKHGCALDNLLSADVVTAEGQLLRASSSQNEDLFWAIRGGGGNFGIVTSFEFQVHPAGIVLAGLVLHPLSKGRDAMRFWREYEKAAPEETSNSTVIFTAPPELPLPESVKREPIVALGGVYVGPLDEGERALQPLRSYGPPAADIYQPMPYSAAQTMADFLWPKGFLSYWKSSFMKSLSDAAIDAMLDFYSKTPSPRTVLVVEHDGDSAWSRVPEDATAFGHRNWPYNLVVTTMWADPKDTDANIQWTRQFWDAMKPFLANAAYVNYLGELDDEGMRIAYGRKYERLAQLKAKYDPTNFFCMNPNIKPARAASGSAGGATA
ncbi:MAG TPA: FAD-binding oxidoreductase [Terriglobales bacterium]|nr:FAD-binding oxidoreductase [Terriglobales bacterium]